VLEHRVGESLPELLASTGERPGRDEDVQSSRTRSIWVLIEHHIGARSACGIHHVKLYRALTPHLLSDRLMVREHYRYVCLTTDLHRLGDSVDQAEAFLAQVRCVDAAGVDGDLRERNDFVGLRVEARDVAKP